jgi:hypothetical protein
MCAKEQRPPEVTKSATPLTLETFEHPAGVCNGCFACLVKLQGHLGTSPVDLTLKWKEVKTFTLEAEQGRASQVLEYFKGIQKPEVRINRIMIAGDIYQHPLDRITEAEFVAAYYEDQINKAKKAMSKGTVKVDVVTSFKRSQSISLTPIADRKVVKEELKKILSCKCDKALIQMNEFVLRKESITLAVEIPSPKEMKEGVLNNAPSYAQALEAKPLRKRVIYQKDSVPLEYQQMAAKKAGIVPPTHPLYHIVPLAVIAWLYSLFQGAAEKPSIQGRKNIHAAWNEFQSIKGGATITRELLAGFMDYCVRSKPIRKLPEHLTTIPQIKKRYGTVANEKIPDWLKQQYVIDTDLSDFLEKVAGNEVNENNVAARAQDPTAYFKVFCGIDTIKTPVKKFEFVPWITSYVDKVKTLVNKAWVPVKTGKRVAIAKDIKILEEKGKKPLLEALFKIPRDDAHQPSVIKSLKNDKITSLGQLIQVTNGLNSALGLESIHWGNFGNFPMLKGSIKKYLKRDIPDTTFEVKVNALKRELTNDELKAIQQVSGKGKRQPNKRGASDKKGGKNTPKSKPEAQLPGVSPASNQKKAASQSQPRGSCNNFWNDGSCRFGNRCKYQHVENNQRQPAGSGNAPQQQSQRRPQRPYKEGAGEYDDIVQGVLRALEQRNHSPPQSTWGPYPPQPYRPQPAPYWQPAY